MTIERQLDPEQRRAVHAIVDSNQAFALTGGPGTGKTTTLDTAVKELERSGQKFLLLAPTGKAALRMMQQTGHEATTVHRLLFSRTVDEIIGRTRVVVVDEASMVDTQILGMLARKILEMSDARLVLVGDPNQLPPVGPGMPFEDLLRSGTVPRVHLQTIYRQKGDSWVVDNAYRVLEGKMVDLKPTHDFTFVQSDNIVRDVMAYLGERYADDVDPSTYQVLSPQRREQSEWDTGATTQRINNEVQRVTNTKGGAFKHPWGEVLRTGDRVIQTKNNYSAGVVNGQMGTVQSANDDHVSVQFDGDGGLIHYSDVAFDKDTPSPRELDLAFATTVHKAQGSEWKDVCFIADTRHRRMLQRRLFYTAITRVAKGRLTIIGSEEAVAYAVKANATEGRNTLLAQKLKGEVLLYGSANYEAGL